jgi:pimeloyl-ACP methyl ester carboxylesterase
MADPFQDWLKYVTDLTQRSILTLDLLRERGNRMVEHAEQGMPPVLAFAHEMLLDARTFDPPANYALLRIVPPDDVKLDPQKPPIVIVDPRAGHGPGIGGFKKDSEIGLSLREGHPTYFVSFFPEPCPGQTLEHVERAEIRFLEEVRRRHPDTGKPILYGNCQAGWAVAMLGADRPDLAGAIVLNGAPMSYWAGAPGVNPMRTAGAFTGGEWSVRWLSDLGAGKFDGAWLVLNFELLHPANTFFSKLYNVHKDPQREAKRFLDFEKWWTGFYLLNEEEISWIVGNLFIGDKLEQGQLQLGEGHAIDMRRLTEPLVIFASAGDDITPPQQALQWIDEVYGTTEALRKHGQRIIYLLHGDIGHLGIFVSGAVALREHRAMIENLERMRKMPPGLYEMKIVRETGETDPAKDQFEVAFEERKVEDLHVEFDKRDFEQTEQTSRQMSAWYETFVRPWLHATVTPQVAEMLRQMHPDRFARLIFSDRWNPLMAMLAPLTEWARTNRVRAEPDSPYPHIETALAKQIESNWETWRTMRDAWYEAVFQAIVP